MRNPSAPLPLHAAAFAGYLDRMQLALFRFVRHLVGDPEQAHDVVQDVFVDAWRMTQRVAAPFTGDDDEAAVRRWLFHAAYHRAISVIRRRRLIAWESLSSAHPPEPDRYYAPVPFEDQIAEGEVVRLALATLGPEDAGCLLLSAVHGFTAVEIAHILAITPEAAKKRLSRAKQRLRNAYFAQDADRSVTTKVQSQ